MRWIESILRMAEAGTAGGVVASPPAAAAPGQAGGAGGNPPPPASFAETLPEGIRNEAAFRDIKDLDGLARGYLGQQKLLGHRAEDLVVLPKPGDDESLMAVLNRLGRPEKIDGYKLPEVKLPDGLSVDAGLQGKFLEAAHKSGLTTRQADALYEWWNGVAAEQHTARGAATNAAEEKGLAALKTEWGAAFEQNVGDAKAALAHYFDKDVVAYLDESRLGNHPGLIKGFAKLGAQLAEDGVVGRGAGGDAAVLSPAEAKQQIAALQQDKEFVRVWRDKGAPGHDEAVARMTKLYEFAAPPAA